MAVGRHVFAVLNKKTISIFEAVHVNSLLASLELSDIKKPELILSLKKLNCFELKNKNEKESGFKLCAKSIPEMKAWMSDIENMLTCKPKPATIDGSTPAVEEETESSDLKLRILKKKNSIENDLSAKEDEEKIAAAKSAEF